ncbi:MAG: hypothetical protein OQK95_03145 [Gammaproteobacteria bacterium]|nr:hypothetical protein [Gammaproteobacteria bacterium]
MKRLTTIIFLTFMYTGLFSNSYANLPVEYTGVAYWGKSPFSSQPPSLYDIPVPTVLKEGVLEDVLGQYLTQNNSIHFWNGIPQVAYCIKYRIPDADGNISCQYYEYHWAIRRSIFCYEPNVPSFDYRSCIAPPAPIIPPIAKMNGDPCDSTSSVGNN